MKLTPDQLRQNAAAMIAFADGKPVQFFHRDDSAWLSTNDLSDIDRVEYRPKPEPKVRPWGLADIPFTPCWIREKTAPTLRGLIVGVGPIGVTISNDVRISWTELGDCEYAGPSGEWHPCTVTEEA